MYPEWVERHHTKGTTIKKINNSYYLYRATSKRVKGKTYPVSVQKYIGRITEDGLIEAEKISFSVGADRIVILGSLVDDTDKTDRDVLNGIGVIETGDGYCCGKLSEKEMKTVMKYFDYNNGRISRR